MYPMIYICVPTTQERRPRLAKLVDSVRKSDYPNTTLVIHEGNHPGCVESVHALLEGVNGLVWMLSDDNEVYTDTLSKLYEAYAKAFPNNDGLVQPHDPIQAGQLPVAPLCHSNIYKKYFYKGYTHNFSDNELKDILVEQGKYLYVPEAKIEHWHVSRDASLQDATYKSNQDTYEKDRELYITRKKNNFEPKNA